MTYIVWPLGVLFHVILFFESIFAFRKFDGNWLFDIIQIQGVRGQPN